MIFNMNDFGYFENVTIKEMLEGIDSNIYRDANNSLNGVPTNTVPINNNNNIIEDNFTPRYDVERGESNLLGDERINSQNRDMRLMRELYFSLSKILLPYVEEVLDQYEYVNSPIYDDEGVDRQTIAVITSRVIDLASERNDNVGEIMLEEDNGQWSKREIFNNMVQLMVLVEVFCYRRNRYRNARNNYRYNNGEYMGVNPQ